MTHENNEVIWTMDVSNKDCSLVSKSVKSYYCVSYDPETQVDCGTLCQEAMQQVSWGYHFKQKIGAEFVLLHTL